MATHDGKDRKAMTMLTHTHALAGRGRTAALALLLALGWLLIALHAFGTPAGPTITYVSNETSTAVGVGTNTTLPGGYIAIMNVDSIQQNIHWKGFVGNISGAFALADSTGYSLYEWAVAIFPGEVYATRTGSGINWAGLVCANLSNVIAEEAELDHNATNTPYDSINLTFFENNDHTAFSVGDNAIGANTCNYSLRLYVNGSASDADFEEIILWDNNSDNLVYVGLMENNAWGFQNGSTFDYQLMVPENGTTGIPATAHSYYFFVELL